MLQIMMEMTEYPDKDFLATEPVRKLVLRLAFPAVVAQVVNLLYNLVDRIYIGHMGAGSTVALTALGVCFPILTMVAAFTALVANGSAPRASIFLGRRKTAEAEKIMGNSFSALVAVACVLTFLLIVFDRPLLLFFGASPVTLDYAKSYLDIYAVGTIFVQLAMGMNNFITAQGYSRQAMISVVIGAALNIALDPIFIFVFHMGVRGAALATIISQACSALYVLRFLLGKRTVLKLRKENLKIVWHILLPSLGLGVGPFIMTSTESALLAAFNVNLLKYGGNLAIGAMTICNSVVSVIHYFVLGLGQGGQPVISFNYGSGDSKRMHQAIRVVFVSSLVVSFTFFSLFELFPGVFAAIFTSDPDLISMSTWALRVYAASVGVFGLQNAAQLTFTSLGQAKVSSSIAILRKLVLLIPLTFILPLFMADKVLAVFMAEPLSDGISVIYTMVMYFLVMRRIDRKLVR
jgi:putative MATE family efflux protein